MNRLIPLLLISFLKLQGQVSVNMYPEVGTQFVIEEVEYDKLNFNTEVKIKGGNKTWDFSHLTNILTSDTVKYLKPEDFQLAKPIAGSNLFVLDPFSPNFTGIYYDVNNAEQNSVGVYVDDTISVKFDKKFLNNIFPLTDTSNFEDQTTYNVPAPGFGNVKVEQEGRTAVEAWGEIKTSKSTYPCLRLRTVTTLQGSFAGIPLLNSTLDEYRWISPGFDYDIFKYSAFESEFQNELENDTTAYNLQVQITSNKNISRYKSLNIDLFPNIVRDELNIIINNTLNEATDIQILDEKAEIIYKSKIFSNNQQINVSNWPRGVYLVVAHNSTNFWGLKKVVLQ